MTLTDDQLNQIKQAGLAQLSIQETADLIEIPVQLVLEGDGAKAYYRGQLQGKVLAQSELFKQAKGGSPAAIRQYVELCNRNKAEVDR